ncbi:FecCD family ABC transporter permease [Trichloromonas sp.]|uniref:FecCD family ABC transporter permease n=1 Tax=Trichloromonas sp. TaxID=3069249 RepID=UPI002A3C8561|nr:iron ABC transporter permease [Desulfuromonadales bacterium]MBN2792295.1 iron ABC transporter permease [Desulfuromonadales bacterium]MDY0269870.1 iron ABC transporter permease [Trichloromonas sp.]
MQKSISAYKRLSRRRHLWLGTIIVFLLITVLLALCSGASKVGMGTAVRSLFLAEDNLTQQIVWQLRLPRICGALLGGAGFAAAGMVLQTTLRNPLASPSTLGISQGAAFGAACGVIFLGLLDPGVGNQTAMLGRHPYLISLFAFGSSLLTTICIVVLASIYRASHETIVLAGVALSAFFMAGTTVLQYFADETQLSSIISWTFGDVGRASWAELQVMALLVGCGLFYLALQTVKFNALLAGSDTAATLGVSVIRTRLLSISFAALMTAIIVTYFGVISFIGLVAPHIARRLVGEQSHILLPVATLLGALLLLWADLVGRTLLSPILLPAGVITAFMGTPVFLFLLFGGQRRWR